MFFQKIYQWDIEEKKGSILLETALVIPVLIAVGLFLYYFAYVFVTYNCVSDAMYRTSDFFARYAQIYHENAVEKIENSLSDALYGSIEVILDENALFKNDFMDFRQMLLYGDDILYRFAAEKIFTHFYEKNPLHKKLPGKIQWDFGHSTFYNDNEEFFLHGSFTIEIKIPFGEWLISGFIFEKTLRCRAFLEGDMPEYLQQVQNGSVWTLSNFQRGEIIQSLYGRNLPTFFPDVDFFQNGTVGTIRSIDHTRKYYMDPIAFRTVLHKLVSQLSDFHGAAYGNTVIAASAIRDRKLILVFPENDFSLEQKALLDSFVGDCKNAGIAIQIERYQRSK